MEPQTLRPAKIVETLEKLHARISERFPGSGLADVCLKLIGTAKATTERAQAAGRPNILLRAGIVMIIAASIYGQVYAVNALRLGDLMASTDTAGLTQALESAVNLLILAGVAIWFLFTLEERLKRRTVLGHLHELRSIAHVIDMHQLVKDPVIILDKTVRTASSPKRDMTEFELARYLDYSSEMLALTGKLAALYGERTRDTQVIASAGDIETLTTNLGRKVWQKITMITRDRSNSANGG